MIQIQFLETYPRKKKRMIRLPVYNWAILLGLLIFIFLSGAAFGIATILLSRG